ncbi:MAG: hypothetical protein QGH21_06575 [Candidatus Poseidoniia archaeon]|nr:hypothetical protein [Candidatus Poseidoniia archaeon]
MDFVCPKCGSNNGPWADDLDEEYDGDEVWLDDTWEDPEGGG